MKVCHMITRLDRGGSAAAALDLCGGLAGEGYDVTLIAGRSAEADEALRRLPARVRFVILDDLVREPAPLFDLRALIWLRRFFTREAFDVVHTHTSKAGFLGRLAVRLANNLKLKSDPKVVHQPHGHLFYGYYGRLGSFAVLLAERLAARWTDRFVALTERGVREHVERGVGRLDQWTAIAPATTPMPARDGVHWKDSRDMARWNTDAEGGRRVAGARPEDRLVVQVGRLAGVKGPDVALEAFSAVVREEPHARLVFVGEGHLRPYLERRATRLGIREQVCLAGHLYQPDDVIAAADVVILPSRNEGFGHALLEAMALGRPVVATAVGGVPDIVEDGVNGLLVPPNDRSALAGAILRLLRDRPLADRLGRAARGVKGRYTLAATLAAVERLYRG